MFKTLLVAHEEYKRLAGKTGFIVSLFALPVLVIVIVVLIWIMSTTENKNTPVGYVDQAGVLKNPVPMPVEERSGGSSQLKETLPLISFATEKEARQALDSRKIQAYYVIPADYFSSNTVELISLTQPGWKVTNEFRNFMRINLLSDVPIERARRAVMGYNESVRWAASGLYAGREFSARMELNNILPMFAGLLFMIIVFMSCAFLMGAVTEEKENRTMEVLMTSVSPIQLMGGKVLSVMALSMTQVLVWGVFVALAAIVAGWIFQTNIVSQLSLDLPLVFMMLAIVIPSFVIVAALMSAIGVIVTEPQEAQQMTVVLLFPFWLTFWLAKPIMEEPNGPLALGLSFFPLSSLPTYIFRLTFYKVPLWQICTTVAILSLCAWAAIWIAGRAFRLGMLRYGKRLKLTEIFSRGAHD